jgi:hypothetical protein
MHHLVEAAQANFVSILPLNVKGQTNHQRSEIMKRHARDPILCEYFMQLSGLPHVLVERSLFERIRSDDPFRAGLIRTLQDLKTAGLLHLPYPEMVVELPDVNGVCEIDDTSPFALRSAFVSLSRNPDGDFVAHASLIVKGDSKGRMAFASPFGGTIEATGSGLEITFGTISLNKGSEAHGDLSGLIGDATDFGFDSTLTSAAMLTATAILSAKGTKREIVSAPAKLNAARAKTNKPPIPQHVVISIGEVFDNNGKAHAFGHGSPRPHLRRGHIRQQAHGPQHSERKQIFINPIRINYVPFDDETTPAPTITVKMASPHSESRPP